MKHYINSSFIYSDVKRSSSHKVRFKKNEKQSFYSANERLLARSLLAREWHSEAVYGWTTAFHLNNCRRLSNYKSIKLSCMYSDRCRSVNTHLGMSKYKLAEFTRAGLLKDLKKY